MGEAKQIEAIEDETVEIQRRAKCELRDGEFVDPCWALADSETDRGKRGIFRVEYYRRSGGPEGHVPSRTFFAMRSGEFNHKGGHALNFCPFCGADISAPFQPKCPTPETVSGGNTGEKIEERAPTGSEGEEQDG